MKGDFTNSGPREPSQGDLLVSRPPARHMKAEGQENQIPNPRRISSRSPLKQGLHPAYIDFLKGRGPPLGEQSTLRTPEKSYCTKR